MMKKKLRKNGMSLLILGIGVISLLYGLIGYFYEAPTERYMQRLMGMFTGFGSALIVLVIAGTIYQKLVSKEKLEQAEVELSDERNIAISRAAGLIGYYVSIVVLAMLPFVLTAMGYLEAAMPCIIGLFISAIAAGIARKVYQKKM